jgi:DNA-binding CsgD family transcriptional regulator
MLHGRSAETARIDEVLAAAQAGRSGALVVRGEAGVGKTALLDYAAGTAAGMRLLRGTGIESEAELPFAALQLLLRPGLGRLDVLPPPQARALRGAFGLAEAPGTDRFLIGLAALSLLSELAGSGALLCLIDDAHWLDRASADALLFAARRLEEEGVVLLIAVREEEGFDAPGLAELPLGRLDRDASRALLAERAPGLPAVLADRVLAEAAGNPLALLELPAALSGFPVAPADTPASPAALAASLELPAPLPLPRRLQHSYYRQVAGLPAAVRTFLLVAAAEETGDLGLVRRAAHGLGAPAAAAEEAERSGLIVVDAQAVAFRHPLVRAAVYQGVTSAERAAAHAALAAALGDPLAGELGADRRAWHRAAAADGPDEQVAAELERAAARARQRLGHAAAAAALERAARLTPEQPDRARRLIAAAGAALDAGRPDAATALAAQAQDLTTEAAAVDGDEPRCRDLAARALDRVAAEDVANVATMAEWALALLDLGLGRYGAALERFELTASAPLRHYIQPILFAPDQIEAAVRLGLPGHAADRAAEPLARFAAWAGATGQPWADAVLHRCRALVASAPEAEDHYLRALRQHAVSGRPFEHARTALLYGEWLRRHRRGTDARAHLRAALALFDRTAARPWADRARAELRAAGEPTAPGASAPDQLTLLTAQELQVVRLAASGATNRDIAAQLFISPRTVSHHLYRAFPKLGVTNRTSLARLDLAGPDDPP